MNEPTEAQVDAGAQALFFEYYGAGWDEAYPDDPDVEMCRSHARAVLTAAFTAAEFSS